ncbi:MULTISPECIES: hypothetical protein [unclassified Pseudomonas]|uniref:hypothetical protein n=1 Tax=unclassified Pseudomonas TaxID=196821 RepID=UPI001B3291B1|nr:MULTISPECIES: hypothetical protein [unclassified Pseudomonas]MBP5946718.1 hypothetical protein [Pseudomonas sp. P9(2020)]MBZ9564856.1 hypothetical protein [Pseudomonas sp. P116]
MPMDFRSDLVAAILLIVPLFLFASMGTDPFYSGTWYLSGVPLVALIPGLISRAPALFLTGTTAAAITTLLIYNSLMSSMGREAGLVGLGHLFSVPGMLVGTCLSIWFLKYRVKATLPWIVASVAFLGAGLGFLLAQMIVCNTLIYCGALSFGIWS